MTTIGKATSVYILPGDTAIKKRTQYRRQLANARKEYSKTNSEITYELIEDLKRKISLINNYKNNKTPFEDIRDLKIKNPKKFIRECKKLVKNEIGINFHTRDSLFMVRIKINGKRTYLGSFETPEDAIEVKNNYLIK